MSAIGDELRNLRRFADRLQARLNLLEKQLSHDKIELKEKQDSYEKHEQAREIIREVGLRTQQQLQYHISDITSLALNAVFDDPYELVVEFVQRRNKTECDLMFRRGEDLMDPLDSSGGGAVDVAAFALRIASWAMAFPRTRSVIILDEPMRFLSTNYQAQASMMLKELSERLNLQFIIITHEQALTTYADRVFEVGIKRGVSYIK